MNQEFWNLFTDDYRENCKKWIHSPENPVLPAHKDAEFAFDKFWTANPATLEVGGRRMLYYRGNGILENRPGERHDRIVAAELFGTENGKLNMCLCNDGKPIVDVGEPGSFDDGDVLDPSVTLFQGKVMLYYSAVGSQGEHVGLAVSEDGEHFETYGSVGRGRAPASAEYQGKLYLIRLKRYPELECWIPVLDVSDDGIHFTEVGPIEGLNRPRDWDSMAITTPRVFRDGDMYYMMYGGSSYLMDEPDFFGLARSRDLLHWEQHPGNPIFGCGAKGEEDGGAIWFPAPFEEADRFSMIYEGSRGKYAWDISSQICLASVMKK